MWEFDYKHVQTKSRIQDAQGVKNLSQEMEKEKNDVAKHSVTKHNPARNGAVKNDAVRSDLAKNVFEWVEDLVIAIVLVAIIFTFILRIITVEGTSMKPNYLSGDRVLVSGHFMNVERGDVVIVTNVQNEGPIIKRIIALEGETVDIDEGEREGEGRVLIDGVPLDDTQFGIENGITSASRKNFNMTEFPITVPRGCVFVLGDNRVISKDSRFAEIGMIDKRNILGKAFLKVLPLSEFGPAE